MQKFGEAFQQALGADPKIMQLMNDILSPVKPRPIPASIAALVASKQAEDENS